ncbi:hypothetical protein Corgl_0801 [Coriobacterium glomerans PW2]|uniref:Bacteriocin-associated integral membrane protein n=1 Tax=Coriobacterium glomerans (strain ATCC 49209 / DSM 20642 / JCM 10262 / PW2) TaxID=700015 RepID=F2N7M2_CORGP|nr:hypothetical protein [Coriobacterium glomerans]AEB06914.1 hypothetical protein Corgl_0801 [Coriobacterium glomerans PW2]
MTKLISVLKAAVIVLIAILLSFLFSELCSEHFTEVAEDYPRVSASFTLSDVEQSRQAASLAVLTDYATENGSLLVRTDQLFSGGAVVGTRLGVAGNVTKNSKDADLDFMGTKVLDSAKLERLMDSSSPTATLGLLQSRTDMIEDLPSFMLGNRIVAEKLSHLVDDTGTANGTYRVTGLGSAQVAELAGALAEASGTSSERILHPLSGHETRSVIVSVIPPVALGALVLLVALFVVSGIRDLPELGACVTCGWSRSEFAFERTWRWMVMSLIAIPISWVFGAWATASTLLSWEFLSYMGGSGLLTVLCVASSVGVASLISLRVPAADAIRNRISRRLVVAVLLVAYIGSAAFADLCGFILDAPLQEMRADAEIARLWGDVSGLRVLERMSAEADAASISGQSDRLSRKFYSWYSSIADAEGVYLAHTQYMAQSNLDVLRGADATIDLPTKPFRTYTASPNYLASQGFAVDPALVAAARSGTRVYLVPDTMPAAERSRIEAYMRRSDTMDVDDASGIQTAFNASRSFSFTTYEPRTDLFCWETDTSLPQTTRDAVICLCVPQNMIFREDESLWAAGLSNSYIKLADTAARTYLSRPYLARFDLVADDPVFTGTAELVAGMRKSLQQTMELFGGVAVLAAGVMVAMVLGLIAAYQAAFREEVAAKRLLGFSTPAIYRLPFSVVGIVFIVAEAAAVIMGSQLGMVLAVLLLALQLAVLSGYVHLTAAQQINRMLKD